MQSDINYKQRIVDIIQDKSLKITRMNLQKYLIFLKNNLEFPCKLLGTKYFMLEDTIFYDSWNLQEYKKLKKANRKNTVLFDLIEFEDNFDSYTDYDIRQNGIFVTIKNVEDKLLYSLRLFELISNELNSNNYRLLDDYSTWLLNYRHR